MLSLTLTLLISRLSRYRKVIPKTTAKRKGGTESKKPHIDAIKALSNEVSDLRVGLDEVGFIFLLLCYMCYIFFYRSFFHSYFFFCLSSFSSLPILTLSIPILPSTPSLHFLSLCYQVEEINSIIEAASQWGAKVLLAITVSEPIGVKATASIIYSSFIYSHVSLSILSSLRIYSSNPMI